MATRSGTSAPRTRSPDRCPSRRRPTTCSMPTTWSRSGIRLWAAPSESARRSASEAGGRDRHEAHAMLSAENVTFGYGPVPVLSGVSMTVPDRGFVGILGRNGSGKPTLLKLLAGTRRPASGRVALDGRALAEISKIGLARRMAVVPQETHLAFDYTVLEVVMMGRYPHL